MANEELDALLRAQDLTAEDLEANRNGVVSERQAAQMVAHRRYLTLIPVTSISVLVLGSAGLAVRHFLTKHDPRIFILPAIFSVFSAFFYAFFALFLRLPRIDGKKVTAIHGKVENIFIVAANNGYVIRIDGKRYKGIARGLKPDLVEKVVTAYLVPEDGIIVAIAPG